VFVITVFTPSLFSVYAEVEVDTILDEDIKAEKVPLRTNDNTVQDEERAISSDGFSVADRKLLRDEEPHKFQAEVHKLMGIIIHSLYSNREIFLRELISNAADAIGKIRFLSLTNPSLLGETSNFEIKIKVDTDLGLLHIRDTGIGMTKQELVGNLGSIAKSGTREFLEKLSASSDVSQIGQFGVGFYSSFLVADKVTVTSKHPEDEQHIWESGANDESTSFTVAKDPRGNTLGRGTLITLHLKEDARQFLDPKILKNLILKYNEFISFPIYVWDSHEEEIEVDTPIQETEQDTEEEEETEDELEVEDEEEKPEEPKPEKTKTTVWSWEHINTHPPLWTRKKTEISEEEYTEFYKNVLKDSTDPLFYTHFKAEGDAEFTALLYCPEHLPYNFWDPSYKAASLKLYVKRVFITDDFENLIPSYLTFIKGIVDSDDFSLNVSREMLQHDKILAVIKKKLVRKIISTFQEIAENPEKYEKFYKAFGTNIKLGIINDPQNKTRLSKLLRFYTANNPETLVSLEEYVEKMKKSQKEIYYLGGETKSSILQSPLLERLTKRGHDVLLLSEPVDEYMVGTLGKYDGKFSLTDISKEGLKLDGEDEEKQKNLKEEFSPLCDYLKEALSEKVSKVEISTKLTKSPCAIVTSSYGYSANMERILKAQALRDKRYMGAAGGKRVLEINPRHPTIRKLLEQVKNDETGEATKDIANVLYDSAVLNSGYGLEKPQDLTNRLLKLVSSNLQIDPNEEVEEEVFEEEEPEEEELDEDVEDDEDEEEKKEEEHEEL
jgi:heat shock protein beta